MPRDYLEAGRAELAIEAASFIVLGLAYMDVLPPFEKIIPMLSCAFFGTLGIYSFNVVTDRNEDFINKPFSAINLGRKTERHILYFSLICKLIALVSAYLISLAVFDIVGIVILGSFIYSHKMMAGGRLKDMFILKNISVAFFWALTPLIPMLVYEFSIPSAYLAIVFFVFISGFISSMTSDLKDVRGDQKAGIKTFPAVFGMEMTLIFLFVLNTLGVIALAVGWLSMGLKVSMFLLPLVCISRYYSFWLIGTGKKSAAYVYHNIDGPSETAMGPLALLGRLILH